MKSRVTIGRYGGNDRYSWAIFLDGRVRLTGLSRSEATYYARLERQRVGEPVK